MFSGLCPGALCQCAGTLPRSLASVLLRDIFHGLGSSRLPAARLAWQCFISFLGTWSAGAFSSSLSVSVQFCLWFLAPDMSALSLDFKYFPWYIILYNFLGVSFFCLFVWGVSVWVFFSFFLFSFLKEGPCFETKGGHSASCSKPLYIFTVKKGPMSSI